MTEKAADSQQIFPSGTSYESNWDHIFEELKRLDLLLHCQVLKKRDLQSSDPLDQFRGLVLSEKEIDLLLSDVPRPSGEEHPGFTVNASTRALADSLRELGALIEARRIAAMERNVYLAMSRLSLLFHLSPFEEQCLIVCLAPELDRKYEKLYAYLQDDITCKKPTIDLALNLLCETAEEKLTARSAFDIRAPLLKYRLLQVLDNGPQTPVPFLSRTLKLDDRITDFLLGFDLIDARIESATQVLSPRIGLDQAPSAKSMCDQIRSFARSQFDGDQGNQHRIVLYFHGPYGAGKRQVAEGLCCDLGLPLVTCDLKRTLNSRLPLEDIAWLSAREALLQQGALCFANFGDLLEGNGNERRQLGTAIPCH